MAMSHVLVQNFESGSKVVLHHLNTALISNVLFLNCCLDMSELVYRRGQQLALLIYHLHFSVTISTKEIKQSKCFFLLLLVIWYVCMDETGVELICSLDIQQEISCEEVA
jgi:hypothetical protein